MSFVVSSPVLKKTQIAYDKTLIQLFPGVSLVETPLVFSPSYDSNKDEYIRKKILSYYYLKATDKWLYNDFDDLVEYFEVKDNKVKLIDNADKKNKTMDKVYYNMILHFIEEAILTKKFIKSVIKEYVNIANVNWYDLYYHSKAIKDLLIHRLKKKIIKLIAKSKNLAKK
jgi:hypothetical protein